MQIMYQTNTSKIIVDEVANIVAQPPTNGSILGDWTSARLSSGKVLLEDSIIPIQQYSYTTGKTPPIRR